MLFRAKWTVAYADLERSQIFKVEDESSGTGLIQRAKQKGGIPIQGIPCSNDKSIRAHDGAPQIAAGNVFAVADGLQPL